MARKLIDEWLKQENLLRVQGWARDGLTNEQIAHNIGIHPRTINKWQDAHWQFRQALKFGKDVADRQVENALFKNAIGYEYKEEQVANDGSVVEVKKYSKPNTTAQIYWLKNRKSREWRDKHEIEHEGNVSSNVNLSNLSDEELRKLAKLGGKKE